MRRIGCAVGSGHVVNLNTENAMKTKERIIIVGSSADTFELKDGRQEAMGYYLNELAIPAQAAIDAGYEIVLVTPKGEQPVVDQHSLVADHFGGSEEALQKALDFVAMNAPFHDAGTEHRGLALAFLKRASEALRAGGICWFVANRHLPYEAALKPLFKRAYLKIEAKGYKVYEAHK